MSLGELGEEYILYIFCACLELLHNKKLIKTDDVLKYETWTEERR